MTTTETTPLIGIVAGESSGDILGANLMEALRVTCPGTRFIGVGGPLMKAQGLESLFPMDNLSVMGIADVLKNLPQLLACKKQVVTTMLDCKPDVFIGIDAPDFNLPIEKKLKAQGITTVHYVSPSVWAWRQGRIHGIKKATDLVLSILPFEPEFYRQFDAACTFVGHPLADTIPMQWQRNDARKVLGLNPDTTYVGLLPGSRGSEVGYLSGSFLEAATEICKRHPDTEFLVPLVNDARKAQFETFLEKYPELRVHLFDGQSRDVIAASDAVVLASGTVSLEAMLIKRPMVVCYRFGWLNYQIFRWIVTLKHFSLPNLLHGGPLVPELLQEEVTSQRISEHVINFLDTDNSALYQRFNELHAQLKQDAGNKAALAISELLQKQ